LIANYIEKPTVINLDWGPVPHFCPLETLQPVWLTPEVYSIKTYGNSNGKNGIAYEIKLVTKKREN
jgi:hypothetical protein